MSGIWQLLIGFRGRIGRGRFWLGFGILLAVQVALLFTWAGMFRSTGATQFEIRMMWVALALLVWISAALIIKRLHDLDKAAWWYPLYGIAPVAAYSLGNTYSSNISNELSLAQAGFWLLSLGLWTWAIIELGCIRGSVGPNQYGPDPVTR